MTDTAETAWTDGLRPSVARDTAPTTDVVLAEVVTDQRTLARLDEQRQLALVSLMQQALAAATTNGERLDVRAKARAVRDAAKHLGHEQARVEASIVVSDAERAVVEAVPRQDGFNARSNTGVTPMDLSRMRAAHEDTTDEQYEAAVEHARETQTPLTRNKIKERQPRPPSSRHPATYTDGLLPIFRDMIVAHCDLTGTPKICDPMAGEGGILQLEELLRVPLRGRAPLIYATDIVLWEHRRKSVKKADATNLPYADASMDVVVTSPPYGNRMADRRSTDGDNRVNYADRRGADAGTNDAAGLQWGDQYQVLMATIWTEVRRVLKPGGVLILNCKDHVRAGAVQRVTRWHCNALKRLGLTFIDFDWADAPGVRGVANSDARTTDEYVAVLRKPPAG